VSYRNGIELGTLLSKVAADRWVVKYKNNNLHDMQVSQTSFGRLLKRSSSSDEESPSERRKRSLRDKRARDRRTAFDCLNAKSASSRRAKKRAKPSASKELEKSEKSSTNMNEEESSFNTTRKVHKEAEHTREIKVKKSNDRLPNVAKTKHSQPKVKEEPKLSAREKRLRLRREAAGDAADEEQHGSKSKSGRPKNRNVSSREKEEVVKVKMNTGTLYLYRGNNPRAVFVRRY